MRVSVVAPWAGSTANLLPDFCEVVSGINEVVIVNDGCDVETKEALAREASRSGWKLVSGAVSGERAGFAGASNAGFCASTSALADAVVFLNSDVFRPRRFASDLVAAVCRDVVSGGIYGPVTACQVVWGMGFSYLDGWCVAATKETWKGLVLPGERGPWDAGSYPGPYWEDADLSLRAHEEGVRVVECRDWRGAVGHRGGGTTGPALVYGESYERNRATFAARARKLWERAVGRGQGGEA